ncbi:F-box/kelch-repeat protein At3g23880-like [Vicia villosa]|uniref:F-box/kelch-repeat protein At3g23880-like n=1 Tax=Vicia villosa TaxID=3911 RepID=UPI00273CD2AC|nr:F-box/kelch-repeat protein At3g23880-like [Vicia villosa]
MERFVATQNLVNEEFRKQNLNNNKTHIVVKSLKTRNKGMETQISLLAQTPLCPFPERHADVVTASREKQIENPKEMLSLLNVKPILRFRCVNKYWDTLITDPIFVNLHLKKSAKRNTHFLLITQHVTDIPCVSSNGSDDRYVRDYGVIPYSVSTLLDNPSFTLSVDEKYLVQPKGCSNIVGSCNGLICLVARPVTRQYYEYSFRLWNPATRMTSPKFGFLRLFHNTSVFPSSYDGHYNFLFGYDNSTDTYKVVASRYNTRERSSDVRILSMGDKVWRDIESFPVVPLHFGAGSELSVNNCGVYFKSSINWLAIQNKLWYHRMDIKNITVKQFVIVSLDLGTETYRLYLPPSGFDQVPPYEPNVGVLGDCLSFSYCHNETHLIIWQMKKFGIQDSWTQFLKISYHNLQIRYDYSDEYMKYHFNIVPSFLSKNDDTLILHCNQEISQAILYNWRNNTVVRAKITARKTITDDSSLNDALCAADYFESLVSVF